jgi:hypothetical protein
MMTDIKLGQTIAFGDEPNRDAVHVAVIPVTAGETLNPGQHVGILYDDHVGESAEPIGIIDPFLQKPVRRGQKCWLIMYPGTVVGLRHEWDHPSLPKSVTEQEWPVDDGCSGC